MKESSSGKALAWKKLMLVPMEDNFHLLKTAEIPPEALQNILVDIDRSVNEVKVSMGGGLDSETRDYNPTQRKKELKEVLVAFARYNTTIEYCQGLSYYAAFLLQFFPAEESFAILCRTIQVNQIESLFDKQLSLVARVLSVHGRVLNLTLPESIRKSIQRIGNNSHDYAAGWYLTLFSRLSPSLYAEVLDLFFMHGFSVLFHVASALVEVGHYTYITGKPSEIDQQTQILFKLAEFPISTKAFKAVLARNMQMLSTSDINHMLGHLPMPGHLPLTTTNHH
ncbi:hypothetical protein NEDG_01802 [Nematocida displodere]|uniref:Rab-GAP TBC domain-containing protein n=1 Tax=Nematocida displodere TaxID=1805483 RepID=A0A177EH73_9MICR|nr:hypothetical protein NEDG_01802 [Nematocida displodere]